MLDKIQVCGDVLYVKRRYVERNVFGWSTIGSLVRFLRGGIWVCNFCFIRTLWRLASCKKETAGVEDTISPLDPSPPPPPPPVRVPDDGP